MLELPKWMLRPMISFSPSRTLLSMILLLVAASGSTRGAVAGVPEESNNEIARAWLDTFNKGDPAAIQAFKKQYVGNTDVAFALDCREESGGFDLVSIETDEPLKLTALLRERNFPSTWRLTLVRESTTAPTLKSIGFHALPMPQSEALAAVNAFATRLAAADKFSGVVAIAKHGKVIFSKAWGLADRSRKKAVTLDTPFLFASQGKMFTAVAVLQLITAGKVALDDPIGKYLTDYPNSEVAKKVTVRHLLTHQGGTGEMGILEPQDGNNRATVRSIADIIRLNGSRAPAFEPGTKWEYSNYGFVLLGALVEKVTAHDYYEYVERHIFLPSGMAQTSYPLKENMGTVAIGYTTLDGSQLHVSTDQLPWRGTPAGGGVSTAGDMLRFVAALNAGKLIPLPLLAEATQNQKDRYPYGFISANFEGFPYWGHGGGAPGNSLVLDYYPVIDTSFICMSNRDPPICDRLAFNYLFRSPRQP
jgi:D-alanyl-D-alanine carboxypeptidase